MDLTDLANQCGTDKGNKCLNRHHYTRIYSELFEPIRYKPIRLLEIGLLHIDDPARTSGFPKCPSLLMWGKYFPNAEIFGFDIEDFSAVTMPRTRIFQGNSSHRDDLHAFLAESGGSFDVIIDDASHASHHQQIALATLFPDVVPGGLYIIEDLHWQDPTQELPGVTKTKTILRRLSAEMGLACPYISDREANYLTNHTEYVDIYDSKSPDCGEALAIIHKRLT